jgi:transposase InsO family protein
VELAREKPRFGYGRLHILLGRWGEHVNHKRVHRGYREAGLMIRRKKRKHCVRVGQPLVARTSANQEWALDFLHDAVECGRAIRVLSVVDAYTRECLALEVDTSFASRRVTRVLDGIVAERGQPLAIRCDNGPELTGRHFLAWSVERQIELLHIQPGKPTQNVHVESFHGRLREECLAVSWFQNLFDARRKIAAWRQEYNEERCRGRILLFSGQCIWWSQTRHMDSWNPYGADHVNSDALSQVCLHRCSQNTRSRSPSSTAFRSASTGCSATSNRCVNRWKPGREVNSRMSLRKW